MLSTPRSKRPRWTRFAKAAARDLSMDIVRTAMERGIEINFGVMTISRTHGCSDWSARGKPFDTMMGDGTQEDIYNSLNGHLGQLQLSEEQTGLVLMIAYGLMKGDDLELLPTTWRPQLMAALRLAVLHGVTPESQARAAASRLEAVMELWRPTWRQDYDCFVARRHVGKLLQPALLAAHTLRKSEAYREAALVLDGPPSRKLGKPSVVVGEAPAIESKDIVESGPASRTAGRRPSRARTLCKDVSI